MQEQSNYVVSDNEVLKLQFQKFLSEVYDKADTLMIDSIRESCDSFDRLFERKTLPNQKVTNASNELSTLYSKKSKLEHILNEVDRYSSEELKRISDELGVKGSSLKDDETIINEIIHIIDIAKQSPLFELTKINKEIILINSEISELLKFKSEYHSYSNKDLEKICFELDLDFNKIDDSVDEKIKHKFNEIEEKKKLINKYNEEIESFDNDKKNVLNCSSEEVLSYASKYDIDTTVESEETTLKSQLSKYLDSELNSISERINEIVFSLKDSDEIKSNFTIIDFIHNYSIDDEISEETQNNELYQDFISSLESLSEEINCYASVSEKINGEDLFELIDLTNNEIIRVNNQIDNEYVKLLHTNDLAEKKIIENRINGLKAHLNVLDRSEKGYKERVINEYKTLLNFKSIDECRNNLIAKIDSVTELFKKMYFQGNLLNLSMSDMDNQLDLLNNNKDLLSTIFKNSVEKEKLLEEFLGEYGLISKYDSSNKSILANKSIENNDLTIGDSTATNKQTDTNQLTSNLDTFAKVEESEKNAILSDNGLSPILSDGIEEKIEDKNVDSENDNQQEEALPLTNENISLQQPIDTGLDENHSTPSIINDKNENGNEQVEDKNDSLNGDNATQKNEEQQEKNEDSPIQIKESNDEKQSAEIEQNEPITSEKLDSNGESSKEPFTISVIGDGQEENFLGTTLLDPDEFEESIEKEVQPGGPISRLISLIKEKVISKFKVVSKKQLDESEIALEKEKAKNAAKGNKIANKTLYEKLNTTVNDSTIATNIASNTEMGGKSL